MSALTTVEVQAARDWAAGRSGCTCRTVFDGVRYGVERHSCAVCRAWDAALGALGVSGTEVRRATVSRRRAA
jgi:hypothetical protein